MKTFLLVLLLPLGLEIPGAAAQSYSISSRTVAGGGQMRGGRFQVAGTLGQPEAGPRMAAGCLSVVPGFWGAYAAVQAHDAPVLHVAMSDPNRVRVAFEPGCGDWVLQWTRDLAADAALTVWTDDPSSNLIPVGGELTRDFHVPSWGPRLFFRLRK